MTSPDGDASPATPSSPVILPRIRSPEKAAGRRPYSEFNLSFRRSNASLSSIFSSTAISASLKRASTPVAGLTLSSASTTSGFLSNDANIQSSAFRDIIVRAFAPRVAILPSGDAEDLIAGKGFSGGLLELLRPYGELIQGKVTIRDSNGSSKSWEDYGVRICRLKDGLESPRAPEDAGDENQADISDYLDRMIPYSSARLRTGGDIDQIEEDIARHVSFFETTRSADAPQDPTEDQEDTGAGPFQLLYLQRLLSGLPMSAHETFSHPVACLIAVSSRNNDPVEELRQLNVSIVRGANQLPNWVNGEFLRYYVLIHDEEHDDFQRSQSHFEQMKRHFGLHCHLLRLRSSQCVPSDDDAVQLPPCSWIAAAEELAEIERREKQDGIEVTGPFLYESDEASVKAFMREMVTQSVIPFMERAIVTWNNDVVSRRRGISGRFISLSKRWAPFGSSRSSSGTGGSGTPSNSNYDSAGGFYRPETPEAIMRKLADYAVMLRDFKLAQSVYDLVRSDFSNDKAWKYYAGTNEMSAVLTLLNGQPLTSKNRSDGIDQLLENAVYSYASRCSSPYYALRGLLMAVELLHLREGAAADDSAKWATRLFEDQLVGSIGTALAYERVASCYASRKGVGSKAWGARRRKSALWRVMATHAWLGLGYTLLAGQNLSCVIKLYEHRGKHSDTSHFRDMLQHLEQLKVQISEDAKGRELGPDVTKLIDLSRAPAEEGDDEEAEDSQPEQLGGATSRTADTLFVREEEPAHPLADDKDSKPVMHSHRKSLSIQMLESTSRLGASRPGTESNTREPSPAR